MQKPRSIDDYLANVQGPQRSALVKLRKTIRALLPSAVECISYSMPAFRHEGHVVAGFLATKSGCSYFPFSGTTLATLAPELAAYGQTKSALHFEPARPLPATLVKKLLKARIAETLRTTAKASRPRAASAKGSRTASSPEARSASKSRAAKSRASKKRARA